VPDSGVAVVAEQIADEIVGVVMVYLKPKHLAPLGGRTLRPSTDPARLMTALSDHLLVLDGARISESLPAHR
jgi:hypothetical protein